MPEISRIAAYQVDLPLREGSYDWADGKSVEVFDSTVVEVETDGGLRGVGEVCPLGPAYLPAYAGGVRAGLRQIGPAVLGQDPTQLGCLNRAMDAALKGHPYVKSGVDVACWDLLGRIAGQPVCHLLGGRFGPSVELYRAISQAPPDSMAESVAAHREAGYRRFQLKVGEDPDVDVARIRRCREVLEDDEVLVADANTGWLKHEALRVARGVRDLDVYVEQPCSEYEDCLSVRRRIDHPLVLDESITGPGALLRGHSDHAMDVVNVKISKFGGLTKASRARDLSVAAGLGMTIEDSWGGDIATAAIAHLAHSTPEEHRFTSTDFNSYVTVSNAEGAPRREDGSMSAPSAPGLGVTPRREVLGDPVLEVAR